MYGNRIWLKEISFADTSRKVHLDSLITSHSTVDFILTALIVRNRAIYELLCQLDIDYRNKLY